MSGRGVEGAFTFLDQITGLWRRSTNRPLRHTFRTLERNRERWATSPTWEAAQQASFRDAP